MIWAAIWLPYVLRRDQLWQVCWMSFGAFMLVLRSDLPGDGVNWGILLAELTSRGG